MESAISIGVLGLQGSVAEHLRYIESYGAHSVLVRHPQTLQDIDALVLPGGESTTIGSLMQQYNFIKPIQQFAKSGKPILGTCAGMVLLAKKLVTSTSNQYLPEKSELGLLGLMDLVVCRNAFGRQKDSFEADLTVSGMDKPYPGIFIRAPYGIEAGKATKILSQYAGKIVLAQEDKFMACAFHPELTGDYRILDLWLKA